MPRTYPSTDRVVTPSRKKPVFGIFLLGLALGMLAFAILFGSPRKIDDIKEFFRPPVRPYAAYVDALKQSKVAQSVMGKAWLAAGMQAFQQSTQIMPPHLESGYISSLENQVISYQIKPRKGQLLSVRMDLTSVVDSPQVFIELFEGMQGQQLLKPVAFADSGSYHLEYHVDADETYLLRIQPELLARFSYRLQVALGASLAFPVEGKDSKAIKSFWGDSRDGGRRKHKGVDIFARRGTPVLAAADGRITRVRNGGLGGKVVWQRDASERYSLYYAHLDTQMVRRGQYVKIGDTLGLVGNTGNARFTPPHLHFGVYQRRRGAVDPFPFVHTPNQQPARLIAQEVNALDWYRTKRSTKLLLAPSSKAEPIQELAANTPVQRLAASGRWHRVQLLDGTIGFVSHTATNPSRLALRSLKLDQASLLFDHAQRGVVVDSLASGSEVEVHAQTASHYYVKTAEGQLGYLKRSLTDASKARRRERS